MCSAASTQASANSTDASASTQAAASSTDASASTQAAANSTDATSTASVTALDKATQDRLLKFWNAELKADEVHRAHLSDHDLPTNCAPTSAPGSLAPIWSRLARDMLDACRFREFAHAHQTYPDHGRSEDASVVLIEILKPGYEGVSWCKAKKLDVLVSLTGCETPGRDPAVESAAHVHVVTSNKLQPVLVANLSPARHFAGHGSFLVKSGNRALADGLAWQTGVFSSSSTARRATEAHGPWHLTLLVGAARAFLASQPVPSSAASRAAAALVAASKLPSPFMPFSPETAASMSDFSRELAFLSHVHAAASASADGGVKGIPPLALGFPVLLWHAAQDGVSAGKTVSAGKRKRVEASDATRALLGVLATHGLQVEAAAKSTKSTPATLAAVGAAAAAGGMDGVYFFDGRLELPVECFHLILSHSSTYSLLTSIQRVAKAWLSACQEPSLYKSLDRLPLAVTMTPLLALLKQPKFRRVERLVLHHKIKLGVSGAKQLGAIAQHLQHIDACSDHKLHFGDHDLLKLAQEIPTLRSLRLDMWNATSLGIAQATVLIGARLEHLHVEPDNITEHYMSDAALRMIARGCPELRSLSIEASSYTNTTQVYNDLLTHAGLLTVLGLSDGVGGNAVSISTTHRAATTAAGPQSCTKLEALVLNGTINVGLCLFRAIVAGKSSAAGGGLALKTLHVSKIPSIESGLRPYVASDPHNLPSEAETIKAELAGLLDFKTNGLRFKVRTT